MLGLQLLKIEPRVNWEWAESSRQVNEFYKTTWQFEFLDGSFQLRKKKFHDDEPKN